jgi:hypothetical protein
MDKGIPASTTRHTSSQQVRDLISGRGVAALPLSSKLASLTNSEIGKYDFEDKCANAELFHGTPASNIA